jgi:hypothetical protein
VQKSKKGFQKGKLHGAVFFQQLNFSAKGKLKSLPRVGNNEDLCTIFQTK